MEAGTIYRSRDWVDFSQPSLYSSAAIIGFCPLFWNTVARYEHRSRFLTRLFGGQSRPACYALALVVFTFSLIRDAMFEAALSNQPTLPAVEGSAVFRTVAYLMMGFGVVLVLSSIWALGIVGTYLGDYFGILMDHKVTSFPFSHFNAPMYHGSTISFFAAALLYGSPAGFLLSTEVLITYQLALAYEDPFTRAIYAERDRLTPLGAKAR